MEPSSSQDVEELIGKKGFGYSGLRRLGREDSDQSDLQKM